MNRLVDSHGQALQVWHVRTYATARGETRFVAKVGADLPRGRYTLVLYGLELTVELDGPPAGGPAWNGSVEGAVLGE